MKIKISERAINMNLYIKMKETKRKTEKTLERVRELDENDSDRKFLEPQLIARIKFYDDCLKDFGGNEKWQWSKNMS